MPAKLTTEEELFLDVNVEIARAIRTHTIVEGNLIAAGRPGPWEYYLMLSGGDAKFAAKLQGAAYLGEMMNNARR